MLKRTFNYTDFDGEKHEEDAYFNLTMTEVFELNMSVPGGFAEYIRRIVNAKDAGEICKNIRNIILTAYGEKSPDGRRFIKSQKLSEEFSQTPMYDMLFQELAFDDEKMSEFIEKVVPDQNRERGAIVDFVPGPLPEALPSARE